MKLLRGFQVGNIKVTIAKHRKISLWVGLFVYLNGCIAATDQAQQGRAPALKMYVFSQQSAQPTALTSKQIGSDQTPSLNMVVFDSNRSVTSTELKNQQADYSRSQLQTDIHKKTPQYQSVPDQSRLMYDLSTGYQRSRMSWNVASPTGSPNPLTEVEWSDLELWGVRGLIEIVSPSGLAIKTHAGYAGTYNGTAQETGYAVSGRQFPFSQINSQANDGYAFDATVGLGYQFLLGNPQQSDVWFSFTPLTGYAYYQQQLTMSDGQQAITNRGLNNSSLSGKENTYTASWHGPWLGADMNLAMFQHHELFTTFEYHWVIDYDAEGEWQQASNLLQPDSFNHRAEGTGYLASIGYRYHTSDLWGISLSFDYQNWNTDPGTEELHFSTGETVNSTLNEVEREAFGVNIGLNVAF